MSLKQLAQMDSGEDLLGMETNKKILLLMFASVCHAILNFLKSTFVSHFLYRKCSFYLGVPVLVQWIFF
jgi:hypothetical protein